MRKIVFGPVPSRRLGYSLGVNNVYDKYCSYSCIYCQAGRTTRLVIDRMKFYEVNELVQQVIVEANKKKPDVVSFVPNGEPTLDINLGREAELIKKELNLPLAIFTNSSLLTRQDVIDDLMFFDIVSVKVDTVKHVTWRKINRPHPKLCLEEILDSIKSFSKQYEGRLITETMLVKGVNDNEEEYESIAEFIAGLRVDKVYIQAPIRPPAEKWVKPPSEDEFTKAYHIFHKYLGSKVELLISSEPKSFKFTDNLVEEIASTIYVHPIRIDYVSELAVKHGKNAEQIIDELLRNKIAKIVEYEGKKFLVPAIRR
ncbi:MAG: radical SAM protein [Staphylothermus sp.]|nr:radical SAM protein [Staphylothermus sp.]